MTRTNASQDATDATPDTDWFPDEGGTDLTASNNTIAVSAGADIDAVAMSFDELAAALGGELVTTHELDPREQFDKDDLINVPFIIYGASIKPDGDYGVPWVTLQIKTITNKVGWINDGSSGIRAQMLDIARQMDGKPFKGLLVAKGLVKSTYNTVDAEGKPIVGTTYYLSTAAGD